MGLTGAVSVRLLAEEVLHFFVTLGPVTSRVQEDEAQHLNIRSHTFEAVQAQAAEAVANVLPFHAEDKSGEKSELPIFNLGNLF